MFQRQIAQGPLGVELAVAAAGQGVACQENEGMEAAAVSAEVILVQYENCLVSDPEVIQH